MSMGKRSGLRRGDVRRNERLIRLRGVVRRDYGIVAVDLADAVQALVVCDHDSRVLARRTERGRAWQLDEALEWGRGVAAERGFAGVVGACEPTGHRWRVLAELCDTLGVRLVCVQPMLVHRAREAEDFTRDKSDDKDAVLIARLAAELRCYLPEPSDAGWARLRHLGARRAQLTTQVGAARQQLRDLLECAWPAVLAAAADPLDSVTWRAAVTVALARAGTDPAGLRRLGYARFARAVTVELGRWGGKRRCHRVLGAVWAAATDPAKLGVGVAAQRPGALERAALVLGDWHHALGQLAETEQRMTGILDQLQLTSLVASIPGLSAVGAAAILAETGDQPASTPPARWSSTPACAPATTSPAPTPAPPASPGEADPPCGWRPGGPSGVRCTPTPSSAPATSTSPAATTTSSPPPKPAPRWPRPCCGGCGSWSPDGCPGRPPSPPASSTPARR
jgi:transposase